MKTSVGIIGASGYTGEALIRLLGAHPRANLAAITSRSLAGMSVAKALPILRGHPAGHLVFDASDPASLASRSEVDTWFLCLPHGVAAEYAGPLLDAGKRVIDLSADFRLQDPVTYHAYYGAEHPRPDLLALAPYVIPELFQERSWHDARLIACPGCYPTSIQLPLVPLLRERLISSSGIIINSYSGISGAGKKAEERYLFTERTESLTPYGLVRHRHLSEIEEQLSTAAGRTVVVQFTPHLAPIHRGILTTITLPAPDLSLHQVRESWSRAFAGLPFVLLLPEDVWPDTAHVARTNRADLAAAHDPRTGNLILMSAIDNLLKGAAGQAVQIFNLLQGWDESAGLPV